ncbi:GDP-mannose transporter [Mitosporidium daphniae]|uniref:GDP-mannose transporter n=1 Tax=Mitosporidium daphniae TaxID=1485682 RepID=A0A098VS52_9MICR|nr:GDP-mannose transporter [Mitosporidium daphniae]KGG51800.1 GDP-mannose transporter [Mitosporidium daphniae]|eukprot:XP_013238236.1 GDP-mannose transporter [Mitosporidium daphniae]
MQKDASYTAPTGGQEEPQRSEKKASRKFQSIVSIILYCFSSISTTVLNKYLLSDLNFGLNCFLLVSQCFFTMFLLLFLKALGVVKFKLIRLHELIHWLPVTLLLSVMVFTGTKILEHCSISLVTVFKNSSILLVAFGDWLLYSKRVSLLSFLSFVAVIVSSMIGVYGDPNCTFKGVGWLVLNVLSSASYFLSLKGVARRISFKNLDAVFNNNLIMLAIFAVISPFADNWNVVLR